MKTLRLFFAIDVPKKIRDNLFRVILDFKKVPLRTRVSWVKPENIHTTIKFLGEVDALRVNEIISAAETVKVDKPPELEYKGIGAFPDLKAPRVIWAGVENRDMALTKTAEKLENALFQVGFNKEKRAFSPHLTLGRVREKVKDERLANRIRELNLVHFGEDCVKSFYLIKSELAPNGSIYTKLRKFDLLIEK